MNIQIDRLTVAGIVGAYKTETGADLIPTREVKRILGVSGQRIHQLGKSRRWRHVKTPQGDTLWLYDDIMQYKKNKGQLSWRM